MFENVMCVLWPPMYNCLPKCGRRFDMSKIIENSVNVSKHLITYAIFTLHCMACCETQWRHSVKTRLYETPSPILNILWNSVTSLSENKVI